MPLKPALRRAPTLSGSWQNLSYSAAFSSKSRHPRFVVPSLAKPFQEPIAASPVDGEVVLLGQGVCGSYAPEAVLASVVEMRRAAEEAIRQRELGAPGPTL